MNSFSKKPTRAPQPSARVAVLLGAFVVAALIALALVSRNDFSAVSAAAAAEPEKVIAELPASALPTPMPHRDGPKQRAKIVHLGGFLPADYLPREHYYGENPDAFIRQPHDYVDAPEKLGSRAGYALFDLERIQDMVRRGMEPDSEIARVKGAPLTAEERAAARQVLQGFFDESVIVVDAVLDGVVSPDDAFLQFFLARRQRLNQELRDALHLTRVEFYTVWPHVKTFDDNIDVLANAPGERSQGS